MMRIVVDDGRVYTLDEDGTIPELGCRVKQALQYQGRRVKGCRSIAGIRLWADELKWKYEDGQQRLFLSTDKGVWRGGKGFGRGYKSVGYIVQTIPDNELRSIDAPWQA